MAAFTPFVLSIVFLSLAPAGAQADPGAKAEQPAILAQPAQIELEVKDAPIDGDDHRLQIEAGTTVSGKGVNGATVAVRGDKKLILTGKNDFNDSPGVVVNLGGEARVDVLIDQNGEDKQLGRLRLRAPGISLLSAQEPNAKRADASGMTPSFAREFALLRFGGIYDDDRVAGTRTAGVDMAAFTGGVQKSFTIGGLPMDVCFMAEPARFVAGLDKAAGEETQFAYRGVAEACVGARLGEAVEIRDNAGIEANVATHEINTDGKDGADTLAFKGVEVRNRLSVNTRLSKDVTLSTAWTYERSMAVSATETSTTTNRHLFTVGVGF